MKRISCFNLLLALAALNQSSQAISVANFTPVDDAQIAEGQSSSNYGSATFMHVQSESSGSFRDERAWLKFDLNGQLPPGATVSSATLRLQCWKVDDQNLMTSAHGSTDDSWDEATITWANQPGFGGELGQAELIANFEDQWYEWDVTSFVQAQLGGDQIVSLVVKPTVEGQSPSLTYAFDSKESGGRDVPQLRVRYEGTWPATNPLKIIHINDMHSRITPHTLDVPGHDDVDVFEKVGGASAFTTKLLELKGLYPDALVLDAGDVSEGNPLGDLRGNGGQIDYMNILDAKLKALGGRGIDASVVGNHDVRKLSMVLNMKNNATFPFLSINITEDGTMTPYFQATHTITVNGLKIGLFGYSTDDSTHLGPDTEPILDVVKCVWDDNSPSTINVKDIVADLRNNQNCDMVIMLSHVGHRRLISGDDAILQDTGGVDPPELVVSGHWHVETERVWRPAHLNGKTLIAEAASYFQLVGELDISEEGHYLSARKHVIRCDEIVPDPNVDALIDDLIAEYNAGNPTYALDQVIGYSAVDLRMDKDRWWTISEFPWSGNNTAGAWIADSMCWKVRQLGYDCDLAMQSGGGIRRDVPAGPITYLQLYETYPWSDDYMYLIEMTGAEIWGFIENESVGVAISQDWHVFAEDGEITDILYQGRSINLAVTYDVAVSEFMYLNENWDWADPTPFNPNYSIRQSTIDYTSQFQQGNPMDVPGERYTLNTEFAGGFRAVVTMIADDESQPYFEEGFIRFLNAIDETVEKRGIYTPEDLVDADGSINYDNQFSEIMHYRSHLGFDNGLLRHGDIIEVWGEGGFFGGNPEFIDQEGIWDQNSEIKIVGHDPTLAKPEYYGAISDFLNDWHENHFIKLYARKTGNTAIQDAFDTGMSVYGPGGFDLRRVPGEIDDLLELTGVITSNGDGGRRFRCHTAVAATTVGFPPYSRVDAISPAIKAGTSLTLTAAANDVVDASGNIIDLPATQDSQAMEQFPTALAGSAQWMDLDSQLARNRRAWLQFDLSSLPVDVNIASATLRLQTRTASGPSMIASVHAGNSDAWTEGSINWSNQPGFGAELDNVNLSPGVTNFWYNWDVTSAVLSELTGDQTVSFVVKPQIEDSAAAQNYEFYSKENGFGNPQLRIELASDTGGDSSITQVDFYYRHSTDQSGWGNWTLYAGDPNEPYAIDFDYPAGYGFYEFYSVATDVDGNVEDSPFRPDARVEHVEALCPNLTGETLVNYLDFVMVKNDWLAVGVNLLTDFNGDGQVNMVDLKILYDLWLLPCP